MFLLILNLRFEFITIFFRYDYFKLCNMNQTDPDKMTGSFRVPGPIFLAIITGVNIFQKHHVWGKNMREKKCVQKSQLTSHLFPLSFWTWEKYP